jgi:selenocysteine-specific translation elongation factor
LICDRSVRGAMKHLTIGLFHDDTFGRELGRKGTESDILMFNRKMEEHVFTFMSPLDDKIFPKSQIASSIDAAIIVFSAINRELGETVVMLDSFGVSDGIAVTSLYATPEQIAAITKDTSVGSFIIGTRDSAKILEVLKRLRPRRDTDSPVMVVVDHSFSVKGVGEVVLGFVKKGIVRKYDTLALLPANKQVVVRSIQMQDEDFDQAEAGARVGLAIKNATIEEMRRGSVLCAPDSIKTSSTLYLSFQKNSFYPNEIRKGDFHATVGMQTLPVTITEVSATKLSIETKKPVVYTPDDIFLLLDLNATRTRIMGKGQAMHN